MRFRLDEKHYIDDQLLEPMTEIGDDTPWPFRYLRDTKIRDERGAMIVAKSGQAMVPSRAMTPLDDEAKRMFEKTFGEEKPNYDPTAPIPVMGNVKQTGGQQPNPTAAQNQQRVASGQQPHNPAPTTLANAGAPVDPNKGPVPGQPDGLPVSQGGPHAQATPPSPAPSGPGAGEKKV